MSAMDGQQESFNRKIKSRIYGRRGILVRMSLDERNGLRRDATAAGQSLAQFCRVRLGLAFEKRNVPRRSAVVSQDDTNARS